VEEEEKIKVKGWVRKTGGYLPDALIKISNR
jgi:hypothetical protein